MNPHRLSPRRRGAAGQHGVVLPFTLIAMVIMLLAAVALVRSFQGSLFTAGNIGFKRDLQNQSERALATVLPLFKTGALSTTSSRAANLAASNYSASMLTVNAQGIPTALIDDTAFSNAGFTSSADITPTTDTTLPANQIKSIRYVIDRMCSVAGNEATLSSTQCLLGDNPTPTGTSATNLQGADRIGVSSSNASVVPQTIVYRLSIRVTGPRDTQSFFQSTFTVPS